MSESSLLPSAATNGPPEDFDVGGSSLWLSLLAGSSPANILLTALSTTVLIARAKAGLAKAVRAAKRRNPSHLLARTLDSLARGGDHAAADPLRKLSKADKAMLRQAADDICAYGAALVTLLNHQPGALDMLGPLIGAARVIGWYSGPQEVARPYIEQHQADTARRKRADKRAPREAALKAAILAALRSPEKRTNLAPTVNALLEKDGRDPVTEQTIKRARRRMGLIPKKTGRSQRSGPPT